MRLVVTAVPMMCVAALLAPVAASAEGCANEQFRTGASAALPDCRAYEMVSPPGFQPVGGLPEGYEASVMGGRIAYFSKAGAPAGFSTPGPYFLAKRGPGGWVTQNVLPSQTTASGDFCYPWIDYSPDLTKGVLSDGWAWGEGYPYTKDDNGGQSCSHDEPELVPGEARGAENLFLRDSETGSYQLINLTPPDLAARNAWFQGGSTDFSHILFTSPLALTGEAPTPPEKVASPPAYGEDLYEWVGGVLRLVTVLPGGEAAWGLLANGSESAAKVTDAQFTHALSDDGERVFFYAGGEVSGPSYLGGNLYLRENAGRPRLDECAAASDPCTVQLDASEGGPESGDGHFQWATPDGARVFFTDERKLTEGSKAEAGKPDLYEYDLERPADKRLLDLTGQASEPASVQGLSGISNDGSHVYFVAEGVLSGTQTNSHGDSAQAGKPNLYLRQGGATTFIATLDAYLEDPAEVPGHSGDFSDWDSYSPAGVSQLVGGGRNDFLSARVSPDGRFLAFNSLRELTGYDNVVEATGLRANQIFLYNAATGTLSCASCDPTGAPPRSHEETELEGAHIEHPQKKEQWRQTQSYFTHQLADDGTVFFQSNSRLLPGDENGKVNVYEYRGGQLHLISSGKSADDSYFRDATPSGDDVYLISTEALVPGDKDNTMSLYDARVGGGLAEPPQPPEPCNEENACRSSTPEPTGGSSPLSATFQGPGNIITPLAPPPPKKLICKKGFKRMKVRGRTVCRRHRRHKHKHPGRGSKRGAHR